ncbi:hypothetical protein [Mycobacterium sp. M26]|uniref:T3SS (YopN, CesT) and YbjN peptide-binding chaperone 1 n=1 Tax=Mycobacterium sp. M26 TaxID=1762962 RepID=UPI00073F134E|nr:hypothetical protein [Mycobacterium sp. M26]
MSAELAAATRNKVQQYLTRNFSNVNIDEHGDFSLRQGSARIFVRVVAREGVDWTHVSLWAPILLQVKETPEVFEYIALHADDYIFGHLHALRVDGGLAIGLTHNLLGDYLDEDELGRAVGGILGVADEIDDELKTQFGGSRFHED